MAFVPMTKINLLNVPIDKSQQNQILFANMSAQLSYFSSTAVNLFSFTDFTYQRKDNIIRVGEIVDKLYMCNYVRYQNLNFNNKWFYAFITDLKYINDNCTEITIETDVFQTWYFDLTFLPSFIEREHANNDTIGYNIIEENLELGDYVVNSRNRSNLLNDLAIITASTVVINDEPDFIPITGSFYSRVYGACGYFACEEIWWNALSVYLYLISEAGKAESINCIYMFPKNMINANFSHAEIFPNINNPACKTLNFNVNKNLNSLNGYVPKNNKLYTHPYNFALLSNNMGNSAELKFELFSTDEMQFELSGSLSANPTIKCSPLFYRNNSPDYEYGVTMGGYPICNWRYGVYENWLAQNQNQINMSYISSGLTIAGGAIATIGGIASANPVVTSGGIGTALSGALQIGRQLSKISDSEIQPPQAKGNVGSGNLNIANNIQDFYVYNMSIKFNQAELIDNYFSMFGYKTNKIKVPNLTGRKSWNYIKTTDINITGLVSNEDMIKLKNIFNNGITLWHNPSNVGNYSLDNSIV